MDADPGAEARASRPPNVPGVNPSLMHYEELWGWRDSQVTTQTRLLIDGTHAPLPRHEYQQPNIMPTNKSQEGV